MANKAQKKEPKLDDAEMTELDGKPQHPAISNTDPVAVPVVASSTSSIPKSHAAYYNDWSSTLATYAEKYSESEPLLLERLRKETDATYPINRSRMLCGPNQGAFLSLLATISQSKMILELGSFTGYSTICLAMNYANFTNKPQSENSSVSKSAERHVYSCEIDSEASEIAHRYFNEFLPSSNSEVSCLVRDFRGYFYFYFC
jgi:hypothetical protein